VNPELWSCRSSAATQAECPNNWLRRDATGPRPPSGLFWGFQRGNQRDFRPAGILTPRRLVTRCKGTVTPEHIVVKKSGKRNLLQAPLVPNARGLPGQTCSLEGTPGTPQLWAGAERSGGLAGAHARRAMFGTHGVAWGRVGALVVVSKEGPKKASPTRGWNRWRRSCLLISSRLKESCNDHAAAAQPATLFGDDVLVTLTEYQAPIVRESGHSEPLTPGSVCRRRCRASAHYP